MSKKSIDRTRSSAGQMRIGTPDDQSDITTMLVLGGRMYVVKDRGIYAVKLADEIDPARTNASIPPVQQRILPVGSESPLVGQTLLTAKELFSEQVMPKWFDCTAAILCSLEALKDLSAVQELRDAFVAAEDHQVATVGTQPGNTGALVLPAIANVDAQCKTFFQKADHAIRSLLDIVQLFYKERYNIRGIADLTQYAQSTYGDADPLVAYLKGVAPALKFVRDTRNGLEHPNPPAKQVTIADFALGADGLIARPSIEVISGRDRHPKVDISAVMSDLALALPQIFEGVVAGVCGKHIEQVAGYTPFLIHLGPEHRGGWRKHVQYGYGIRLGDSIAKLG